MAHLLHRLLDERGWLLADGAIGTNLFACGLRSGDAPELWNLDRPERIDALHRAFIDAGADIVLTNSFGANRFRLALHRAEERVWEINAAAARIARAAVQAAGRAVLVAGSIGPTGELFAPLGPLDHEAARDAFATQAAALAAAGVDILWVETMSSREELEAALAGAAMSGLPVICTVSFDTNGSTMMGLTPADLVQLCARVQPAPEGFGTNCGVGAAEVVACLLNLVRAGAADRLLVAKANCGIPYFVDGAIRYDGTPELMADYARLARDAGARIIGGCCGTTPAHLRAMKAALEAHAPGSPPVLSAVVERLGEISTGARAQNRGETERMAGAASGPRAARRGGRRGRSPSH